MKSEQIQLVTKRLTAQKVEVLNQYSIEKDVGENAAIDLIKLIKSSYTTIIYFINHKRTVYFYIFYLCIV